MESANCSSSWTEDFFDRFSISGSGEIPRIPQRSKSKHDLTYDKLSELAQLEGVVKSEQDNQFYVITHPAKVNTFRASAPYIGWKLHLSVSDVEQTFDLIAPILHRYRLAYKVINKDTMIDDRFVQGAQITIYLEEEEQPALTPQQLSEMIEEIHSILSLNEIAPGIKPESDAKTVSSFFSMRNDKCKPLINRKLAMLNMDKVGYVSSGVAAMHFNPSNNFNPFSALLHKDSQIEALSFDPMNHFLKFNLADNNPNSTLRLIDTMKACVNEYTHFEALSDDAKETFIRRYCSEVGSDNAEFFKERYKDDPSILQLVRFAFTVAFLYEADSNVNKSVYFESINTAQLSQKYAAENSFKTLLEMVERYAEQRIQHHHFMQFEKTLSLCELYVKMKLAQNSNAIFPQPYSSKYTNLISGF